MSDTGTDTDARSAAGLQGNVGWIGIVFFVVAAAAPLTVVSATRSHPGTSRRTACHAA